MRATDQRRETQEMTTPYSERMDRWRVLLKTRGLNAALVTGPSAVFYLTGFRSDPMERFLGLWVPADGDGVLFVPQLDVAKAEQAAVGHRIIAVEDGDSPTETLRRECGDAPCRCGVEKNRLSWRMSEKLAEGWPDTDFRDIGADLAAMIGRKTREEADCVRTAAAIGDRALEDALGDFRRGMRERELAEAIDRRIGLAGGEGAAFATTVLSGPRTALPHGETGERTIGDGDLLLIDMGVLYRHYRSDMTRTFLVGQGTPEQERLYETVKEAARRAVAAITPGRPLAEADQAARSWIDRQGYGGLFVHRVGHGLGLDIHEEPSIHGRNAAPVVPGMLFTIEPGIYMPGVGGVRIEDDVYVNEKGETETLTGFSRELRRL